jgi:hypothetical protein
VKFLGDPSSGSIAGTTFSHNRFGQYTRNRRTPVNPGTPAQALVRARLANNAAGWRGLTDAQRAGWESLGASITRRGSLGESYTLNGFMTYTSVNNNNLAAGTAVVSDAPLLTDPGTLVTATITLTSAAFSVAYTTTPLSAGVRLFIYVSEQTSAGRSFNGSYKLCTVTAAAAASPANILAAYTALYGVPVTGRRIFLSLELYQAGFRGAPLKVSQIIA